MTLSDIKQLEAAEERARTYYKLRKGKYRAILREFYEDIIDKTVIEDFEVEEKIASPVFLSAQDILNDLLQEVRETHCFETIRSK